MRLLPPQELKKSVESEELSQKAKLLELTDALNQGIRALNELREKDRTERERISAEFEEFRSQKESEKDTLSREVSTLEERKREALRPITAELNALESVKKDISDRESVVSEKEIRLIRATDDLETLRNAYEDKLDELSDRESEVADREQRAIDRDLAIAELDRQRNEAYTRKASDLEERISQISDREHAVKVATQELERKRADLESRESALEIEKAHIRSQQVTIRTAFEESRKKGII